MQRARDLGIELGRLPTGPANAITDVPGVSGRPHDADRGRDVRTGVTVVVPPPEPLFAGSHTINGNGELTGPRVDPRFRHVDDADRPDEHPLGRSRPRCADRVAAAGRMGLEPAGRRGDMGRLPQRHQRLPRPAGARRRRARGGARGAGRGGLGRRRHRHGLPRLQGRDRDVVARRRGRLDAGCPRAGEPRSPRAAARERDRRRRGDRAGRRPAAGERRPEGGGSIIVLVATDAPLLPGNASGSPGEPDSGSRARAGWASARAATSLSASPPATAASPRRGRSWRSGWRTTPGSTRSTKR